MKTIWLAIVAIIAAILYFFVLKPKETKASTATPSATPVSTPKTITPVVPPVNPLLAPNKSVVEAVNQAAQASDIARATAFNAATPIESRTSHEILQDVYHATPDILDRVPDAPIPTVINPYTGGVSQLASIPGTEIISPVPGAPLAVTPDPSFGNITLVEAGKAIVEKEGKYGYITPSGDVKWVSVNPYPN